MHFAINKHHLRFFYMNHYIEFEGLLTWEDAQALRSELVAIMQEKTLTYDMWRHNAAVKRFILSPRLAEIASNLMKVFPLRIAFDLLLSSPGSLEISTEKPLPLCEMSCIQGVVCGCILQLSPPPQDQNIFRYDETFIPIPSQVGNGIFFAPTIPISLNHWTHLDHNPQLLIAYAKNRSLYTYSKSDTNTHSLKNLGYVFGDHLKSSTHPILFRG